jgi:hypothetical protein
MLNLAKYTYAKTANIHLTFGQTLTDLGSHPQAASSLPPELWNNQIIFHMQSVIMFMFYLHTKLYKKSSNGWLDNHHQNKR